MGEVIDISKGNLKHCNYFDNDGHLGVEIGDLAIEHVDNGHIDVMIGDEALTFKRSVLAEFLHVASVFVDSKEVYKPDCDLPAMNYED